MRGIDPPLAQEPRHLEIKQAPWLTSNILLAKFAHLVRKVVPLSCATPPKQTEVWTILVHTVPDWGCAETETPHDHTTWVSRDLEWLTEIRMAIYAHLGLLNRPCYNGNTYVVTPSLVTFMQDYAESVQCLPNYPIY